MPPSLPVVGPAVPPQQRTRFSDDAMRALLRSVPCMLFGTGPDGTNLWISEDWCRFTGRTHEDGMDWRFLEAIHPEDRELTRERWRAATVHGLPMEYQQRIRRHDGVYRWFLVRVVNDRDATGRIVGWYGSLVDVDDLVRAREALRVSEARLAIATEVAGVGVFDRDMATGELWWSDQLRRLHGWSPEATLPRLSELEAHVHPEDRARFRRAIDAGHDPNGPGIFASDYRFIRPDGEVRWLMSRARTLVEEHDGRRVPSRVVGAKIDFTERHLAQEALERANAELHSLSRSLLQAHERERARIARELHDELGQALIGINLLVQGVNRASDPVAAVGHAVDALSGLVERTRRICVDLRPPELEELGLVPAIRNLLQTVGERSGLVLSLEAPDEIAAMDPDTATACFRIVQEAVTNIERHAKAARVQVRVGRDGHRVTLHVRDDGCGFDPANASRGSGIGLLGMRERVALLGGTLTIRSEPTAGTVVEASLPRVPPLPA